MYRKFIASSLPLLVAACVQTPARTVNVPDKLKPGVNESLALVVPAKGVQIYECRARTDQAGGDGWAFVAREAELFDTSRQKIGTHDAGPRWAASDGGPISGAVKASGAAVLYLHALNPYGFSWWRRTTHEIVVL